MNQNLKVVLAVRPVDLRKSFHGLYAAARQMKESPEKGALFVFSNRPRNRVKVLCFDGTGCWVSTKRFKKIGEETMMELDLTPARFFTRLIIRPKYVKLEDRRQPLVVAPSPKRIIENSFASAGLLTAILLGKYADHLPLYRQEQIFQVRHGVDLSRKTMCDWVWSLAHQLAMIYEGLREEIRSSGYLQADETPVSFQNPGNGKCGTGYLWAYSGGGARRAVRMVLQPGGGLPDEDAVSVQGAIAKRRLCRLRSLLCQAPQPQAAHTGGTGRLLGPCAAEVPRGARGKPTGRPGAGRHQKLYRIEANLREQKADVALRLATRQRESLPILAKIETDLRAAAAQYLSKSLTAKAIFYALNQWERLQVYTRHGHMEIDNNLVENAIRPTAVGKKNWLFFGNEEAGQTSAIIYSLLESCRMLGIHPQEYLLDVLPRLPTMTNQTAPRYTPAQWLAARSDTSGESSRRLRYGFVVLWNFAEAPA